ncbi:MAG: hypothetical protein AAF526_01410 [Pseudomonadota bacterium]
MTEIAVRAEAALDAGAQSELAEIIRDFVAVRQTPEPFTPDEMTHLRAVDAEPFVAADPAAVQAVFDRARG